MYLDPRTKILLCVTVSFVMIASDNTGVMRYVLPCMALIPLAAFIILKKYAIAAYYAVLYMISIILPDYSPPILSERSYTVTLCPLWFRVSAAASPEGPEPIF